MIKPITNSPHTNFYIYLLDMMGVEYKVFPDINYIEFFYSDKMYTIHSSAVSVNPQSMARLFINKSITNNFLRQKGLSTPRETEVENRDDVREFVSESKAKQFILKPKNGSLGKGLITFRPKTIPAFPSDQSYIVQEYMKGHEYRILKVGSGLFDVKYIEPWILIGDGKKTIFQLFEESKDGRSEESIENITAQIEEVDAANIILKAGEKYKLSRTATFAQGAIWRYVDLKDISQDAIRILNKLCGALPIKLAGIDILFSEKVESWKQKNDYWVIEVNTAPHIYHYLPIEKDPEKFSQELFKRLFS